jgi:hypothetical protein
LGGCPLLLFLFSFSPVLLQRAYQQRGVAAAMQ